MSEITKPTLADAMSRLPASVPVIDESEQVKASTAVATIVETGLKLATREDREQANDSARILKKGIQTIKDAMTDAFRPVKLFEQRVRLNYEPLLKRLEGAVDKLNAERARWDREEDARVRAEQVRAQREAEEAAAAARAAAAAALPDEEVPGPAQVVVPQVERTTRGAIATTSAVRKVKAEELVDPAEAMRSWGAEAVTMVASVVNEKYTAKMKLGLLDFPPEQGVVVGGVRFVTVTTYSDRGRGA